MAEPFVWGAGGTQLTPERIAAERRVAQAMIERGTDFSPVGHWTQGLARVAQAIAGSSDLRALEGAERANAAADKDMIAGWFGQKPAAAPAVAPAAPAAPTILGANGQPSTPDAQGVYPADAVMMPPGGAPTANASLPRGYRNNNPLNIEAGTFTQGLPGYGGSDGRFARFATMEQGVEAANKLLNTYQSKYGLSTVNGIINRWAPPGENDSRGYAASVAGRMGVDANARLNLSDPNVKRSLVDAMAWFENGQPMPAGGAMVAQADPAALPPNATPTQGFAVPGQPSAAPSIAPSLAAALTSPYTSEGTKKIAQILLQNQLQGDSVTTVDLGNSIGVMDKRGNLIRQLPKGEPNKGPEFGVVGKGADGTEQYGWRNPRDMTVTPYNAPGSTAPATVTGPDGKQIPIPAGVDRKKFVQEVTSASADAATGKKTEVQAKSEKFGNKMELAERNLKDVESEGLSITGKMREGTPWLPGSATVGNMVQSESYQKYRQARDNFITALLRDESGAAIGTTEFDRYVRELFPQPGDSKVVLEQKRDARRVAIEGMKKAAGPGYKSPAFEDKKNTTASGVTWSVE